jgi:hypothetical protein
MFDIDRDAGGAGNRRRGHSSGTDLLGEIDHLRCQKRAVILAD